MVGIPFGCSTVGTKITRANLVYELTPCRLQMDAGRTSFQDVGVVIVAEGRDGVSGAHNDACKVGLGEWLFQHSVITKHVNSVPDHMVTVCPISRKFGMGNLLFRWRGNGFSGDFSFCCCVILRCQRAQMGNASKLISAPFCYLLILVPGRLCPCSKHWSINLALLRFIVEQSGLNTATLLQGPK